MDGPAAKKRKTNPRSKRWTFTSFEPEAPAFSEGQMIYMIYGEEICPDTNKTHWQGYVTLKNQKSLRSMKTLMGEKVHLERAKGNTKQNIAYCSKDGKVTEHGTRPEPGRRTDLEAVADMVVDGKSVSEVAEALPVQFIKYHKGIEKLHARMSKPRTWKTKVICHWGPTGSGKTRTAIEAGAAMVSFENNFFGGYESGMDTILLDEADKMTIPKGVLLQITDRYPYVANVKGNFTKWNPKTIYMTGILHPSLWFDGGDEWLRRIDSIVEFPRPDASESKEAVAVEAKEEEKQPAEAGVAYNPGTKAIIPPDVSGLEKAELERLEAWLGSDDEDDVIEISDSEALPRAPLHWTQFLDLEAGCSD